MKLAIDCRWTKSGIGAYFLALLPYFQKYYECTLIKDGKPWTGDLNPSRDLLNKINSCDAYYTPYCSIPRGVKVPIFSTIHDVVFLDIKLSSTLGTAARKLFYKRAVKLSRAVFTVSQFSRTRILHHLHPKCPVVVTYNACAPIFLVNSSVPPVTLQNEVPQNSNSAKINKENSLLFVGNIKAHKGLKTLLESLEFLPSTHLTIVGSTDGLRTKDKTILPLLNKLGKRVTVDSAATAETLAKYYKTSDILVQPSLYEGFGMPPLEALNSQCKVVLSDIPVFREIYNDFPVTFFKVGDKNDLSQKINESLKSNKPVLSASLQNKYTYDKCFKIIDAAIKSMVK